MHAQHFPQSGYGYSTSCIDDCHGHAETLPNNINPISMYILYRSDIDNCHDIDRTIIIIRTVLHESLQTPAPSMKLAPPTIVTHKFFNAHTCTFKIEHVWI